MRKKKAIPPNDQLPLFELPPAKDRPILVKLLQKKLWTENKAKLIERYLFYFIQITRHGCYIDGFAGPQQPETSDTSWAAKLVMELKPTWLRQFHLFESDMAKVAMLEKLRSDHSERNVHIYPGDFNAQVTRLLSAGLIGQKEATFCLLDQRTFECYWSSLQALASYKTPGNLKIELFYFLGTSWLDRAFSGLRDRRKAELWWGGKDWTRIVELDRQTRVEMFCKRMMQELGYKSAMGWPIYEREKGRGNIKYFMIHATDHPHAPLLMRRAYEKAVTPLESMKQLEIEFEKMKIQLAMDA